MIPFRNEETKKVKSSYSMSNCLMRDLTQYARQHGLSRSEIIEEAVTAYLTDKEAITDKNEDN